VTSAPVSREQVVVERASIGDAYLLNEYRQHVDGGEREAAPELQLGYAYYRYLIKRLVDQFVLSGANDTTSQTAVLNTIAQLAFKVLLAGSKAEVRDAESILSTGRLRESPAPRGGGGSVLGRAGRCEVGKSLMLGDGAAEATPRFDVTVSLTAAQLKQLRARPDVLRRMLDAFGAAVPLHIDYRVYFSVTLADRTFRLVPLGKKPKSGDDHLPLLGITTALGAG
jgi:hypothetical protein